MDNTLYQWECYNSAIMKNLLRQTKDPEVEAGLQETRPFYWFLILVLLILYGISIYSDPTLRQPARFIPYSMLFFIHLALHWYMPYLVTQGKRLAFYLLAQIFIVFVLVLISQQATVLIGLFMALAGETIGILEDWRRSIVAIAAYLLLMGTIYGFMFGWNDLSGWLGSALIMLVFVAIYVLLFLRQMNARAELQKAHTQLAEYAQQVEMLTLEAERQRMARELHDTLAQGLAGLVLQLEALEASLERDNTEKATQIATQAKERARTTLADARLAIDDLRATGLTTSEAINREVQRFATATGIPCTIDMPPDLDVSAQNGEHLVRCVSEGLANVTRHAQATAVSITIAQEYGRIHIQIEDNGQGFDSDGTIPAGHYGLLGLRERARLAQGELTVASAVGEGTTLTMEIPTINREREE